MFITKTIGIRIGPEILLADKTVCARVAEAVGIRGRINIFAVGVCAGATCVSQTVFITSHIGLSRKSKKTKTQNKK